MTSTKPPALGRFALAIGAASSVTFAGAAQAAQPAGYLDSAGCETMVGWAHDPDVPDVAIDVHIYVGGPAGSGAPAFVVSAGVHRDDLCTAIGSCAHGFVGRSPLSLHDGMPHDVFAYGIDQQGEGNPTLGNSPRVLQCDASTIIGVRRKISSPTVLAAWDFDAFWDQLPISAAVADAFQEGQPFPDAPELVVAAGETDVWLVDRGSRRAISPEAAIAWRFDLTKAEERTAAQISALTMGPPVRPRPMTFVVDGLYVIDDETLVVPDPTTSAAVSVSVAASSSGTGAGVGGGGGAADGPGSEGCRAAPSAPGDARGALAVLVAAVIAVARGRVRRRS